jgi:hypothetical protein
MNEKRKLIAQINFLLLLNDISFASILFIILELALFVAINLKYGLRMGKMPQMQTFVYFEHGSTIFCASINN